jgi:hypothetical protein
MYKVFARREGGMTGGKSKYREAEQVCRSTVATSERCSYEDP